MKLWVVQYEEDIAHGLIDTSAVCFTKKELIEFTDELLRNEKVYFIRVLKCKGKKRTDVISGEENPFKKKDKVHYKAIGGTFSAMNTPNPHGITVCPYESENRILH